MPLISQRHGKGRVRVARLLRDGDHHELRELSVHTMVEGEFDRSYTDGDNAGVVATDTIKNVTNLVAADHLGAGPEQFVHALASRLLERYAQVTRATVTCRETRWTRASVAGAAHAHTFLLDANGTPTAGADATRDAVRISSGIAGFTFMKTTQSGWVGFVQDECTTLGETTDRILATAMDATWTWRASPGDYESTNTKILRTMLHEFATTYSKGVQDSLFRMAEAALDAVPELGTITMACPNKHYIPIDLSRFGRSNENAVFLPTDEPHGQIECTVGR